MKHILEAILNLPEKPDGVSEEDFKKANEIASDGDIDYEIEKRGEFIDKLKNVVTDKNTLSKLIDYFERIAAFRSVLINENVNLNEIWKSIYGSEPFGADDLQAVKTELVQFYTKEKELDPYTDKLDKLNNSGVGIKEFAYTCMNLQTSLFSESEIRKGKRSRSEVNKNEVERIKPIIEEYNKQQKTRDTIPIDLSIDESLKRMTEFNNLFRALDPHKNSWLSLPFMKSKSSPRVNKLKSDFLTILKYIPPDERVDAAVVDLINKMKTDKNSILCSDRAFRKNVDELMSSARRLAKNSAI